MKRTEKPKSSWELYHSIRRDWGEVKPYSRKEEDKKRKKPKHKKKMYEVSNED